MASSVSLASFMVMHRGLGCDDEDAGSDEMAERILFYHPPGTPVDAQLDHMSYCEALIDFARTFGDDDCDGVALEHTRVVMRQVEPQVWMVLTVSVKGEALEHADGCLRVIVADAYDVLALLGGSLGRALGVPGVAEAVGHVRAARKRARRAAVLAENIAGGHVAPSEDDVGLARELEPVRAALRALEALSPITPLRASLAGTLRFFLSHIDFGRPNVYYELDALHFFPVDRATYLAIQQCANSIVLAFPAVSYVTFMFAGHVVTSSMPRAGLCAVYKFLRMHAHQTVMPSGGGGGSGAGSGEGGLSVFDSARQWLLGDAPAGAAAGPSGARGRGAPFYEGAVKVSPLAPPLLTQAAAVAGAPVGLQASALPCAWAGAVPAAVYADRAAAVARLARPSAVSAGSLIEAAGDVGAGGGLSASSVAAAGDGGGSSVGGLPTTPHAPLFAPALFLAGAGAAAPSHRLLWHQHGQVSLLLCVATDAVAAAGAGDPAANRAPQGGEEYLRALGAGVLGHFAGDLRELDGALADSALAREAAKGTGSVAEGLKFAYLNRASGVLKVVGMGALGRGLRHRSRAEARSAVLSTGEMDTQLPRSIATLMGQARRQFLRSGLFESEERCVRTPRDGTLVARKAGGREVYAVFDSRALHLPDTYSRFQELLAASFKTVVAQ